VPDDIAWQIVEEATVNMEGPIGKYRWEYAGSELEADTHVLSLPRSCAATLDVVKLLVTQAKRTGMSSIAIRRNISQWRDAAADSTAGTSMVLPAPTVDACG
jgi:hypothetical protein